MATTYPWQSNVSSLPPPGALIAATQGGNAPLPAQFHARAPQSASDSSTPQLAASTVALCLAISFHFRWMAYVEQHRRFQHEFSEDAVHELRVASRRLLAQCDLVESTFPTAAVAVEKARRMLKRRLETLGALRDAQVQRRFVEDRLSQFPQLVLVRDFLHRSERRLAKRAVARLRSFKLGKLEKCAFAISQHLADQTQDCTNDRQLRATILNIANNAYADVVRKRLAINLEDLGTIHSTRLSFKKFRYVMESLSPGVTGFDRRRLRALASYQRKMGVIQDLEVMQDCMTDYIRKHAATEATLTPFLRYLNRRRTRAVLSFARTADNLFEYWPPGWPDVKGSAFASRDAA